MTPYLLTDRLRTLAWVRWRRLMDPIRRYVGWVLHCGCVDEEEHDWRTGDGQYRQPCPRDQLYGAKGEA